MPPVSIVIVTWNGRSLLERCLPSVAASHYPDFEIIVVDNGSSDGTADWLRAHYPAVRVLALDTNLGFCGGNNAGIAASSAPYVVLLNNDVEVHPDWLTPLVAWLEADSTCAAVQPKLLQYDWRDAFEYAGASGGFLDAFGYPFTRGRLFASLESDTGQYDTPQRIFWATGAALALRRSALDEVGLLDERFFMHMEEIDLCWRLQRAGHTIYAVPEAEVYHIGGASLPQGDARKTYYNFRNNLLLLYKNLSASGWRRVFPRRLALDGLAIARFVALGSGHEAAAVLRAYADAHRMKHQFTAERPDKNEVFPPYRASIAADYFLRGRRAFSDLPLDRFDERFAPTASVLEPDRPADSSERYRHPDTTRQPR